MLSNREYIADVNKLKLQNSRKFYIYKIKSTYIGVTESSPTTKTHESAAYRIVMI